MHKQAAAAVMLLGLLAPATLPDRPPRVGTFKLKSEFSLDIPAGSRQVRIWLPLPQGDPDSPHGMVRDSKVTNLQIVSAHAYSTETDSEGNRILYIQLTNPSVPRFELSYTFDLARTETYAGVVKDERAKPYSDADREALARHLQPTRHLISGSPRIKALGAKIVGGETNPARKLRLIYDWMLANVDYWVKHPETKSASAIGDAEWCLDTGAGNCSDFHATFASLARSQGIATRQTYGGLLKADLNGQAVDAGYHCWSEAYLPGLGWVVSDVAVADLWNSDNLDVEKLNDQARVRIGRTAGSNYTAGHNARAVEYYFGNMDERRVLWSFGRDIVLSPPQAGPPVNNMLRGYFEIDGKIAPEWSWDASTLRRRFTYEAVDAPLGENWPVGAPQADAEETAIRETIQAYFKGDLDRDVESLKKAFHPTAVLMTADAQGALAVLTQPDWHARVKATPDRERPTPRILAIDRAGNAATAKTQLVFPHGSFTDFLSLLKIDGRWTIVNKTYHWEDAR